MYGDVKSEVVLFCCCLKYVLSEGNYAAERFLVKTWILSFESNE